MNLLKAKPLHPRHLKQAAPVLISALITAFASMPAAETPLAVNAAVNFLVNGEVTDGVPMTIAVGEQVEISDGVEYPGFAFGTYDVDATASPL